MPRRRKTKPETLENAVNALELRKRGASYRQIAKALDCATSTAHELVQTAMRDTLQEPADEVRQIELERLDLMLKALLPRALDSDDKGQARCAEMVLKLMDRRASYLGLDAPTRRVVDVVTHDAFTEAIAALEAEVAELEGDGDRSEPAGDRAGEAASRPSRKAPAAG